MTLYALPPLPPEPAPEKRGRGWVVAGVITLAVALVAGLLAFGLLRKRSLSHEWATIEDKAPSNRITQAYWNSATGLIVDFLDEARNEIVSYTTKGATSHSYPITQRQPAIAVDQNRFATFVSAVDSTDCGRGEHPVGRLFSTPVDGFAYGWGCSTDRGQAEAFEHFDISGTAIESAQVTDLYSAFDIVPTLVAATFPDSLSLVTWNQIHQRLDVEGGEPRVDENGMGCVPRLVIYTNPLSVFKENDCYSRNYEYSAQAGSAEALDMAKAKAMVDAGIKDLGLTSVSQINEVHIIPCEGSWCVRVEAGTRNEAFAIHTLSGKKVA